MLHKKLLGLTVATAFCTVSFTTCHSNMTREEALSTLLWKPELHHKCNFKYTDDCGCLAEYIADANTHGAKKKNIKRLQDKLEAAKKIDPHFSSAAQELIKAELEDAIEECPNYEKSFIDTLESEDHHDIGCAITNLSYCGAAVTAIAKEVHDALDQ